MRVRLPLVRGKVPFNIQADDIMDAIIPEGEQDELPVGFSIVGHVGRVPK